MYSSFFLLIELAFGNADAAIEVLQKMAKSEGYIGELLANGTKAATDKLGNNSDQYAMHIKGLELPAFDVRGIKAAALSFAVAVRGGCHLTGAVHNIDLAGKYWKFKGTDRLSSDWKGYEVKAGEDLTTVYDLFGICKFSRHMFDFEGFIEFNNVIAEFEKSDADIILMGERMYNLQEMFNVKKEIDRK